MGLLVQCVLAITAIKSEISNYLLEKAFLFWQPFLFSLQRTSNKTLHTQLSSLAEFTVLILLKGTFFYSFYFFLILLEKPLTGHASGRWLSMHLWEKLKIIHALWHDSWFAVVWASAAIKTLHRFVPPFSI